MMRSGNAVLSHCSLIPSETVYEKRRGLLWPIARKKNLISLRSVAFFTIFVSNLVHAYKFHGNFKTAQQFFLKNLTIPRLIVNLHILKVSRTLKTRKAMGLQMSQNFFPQILCFQVSVLIIHWHCFQVSYSRAQLQQKS